MTCQECGMPVSNTDYHPYAACLMFKACHNSSVVQANLDAVVRHGHSNALNDNALVRQEAMPTEPA